MAGSRNRYIGRKFHVKWIQGHTLDSGPASHFIILKKLAHQTRVTP
jgi:hypothetical protein